MKCQILFSGKNKISSICHLLNLRMRLNYSCDLQFDSCTTNGYAWRLIHDEA